MFWINPLCRQKLPAVEQLNSLGWECPARSHFMHKASLWNKSLPLVFHARSTCSGSYFCWFWYKDETPDVSEGMPSDNSSVSGCQKQIRCAPWTDSKARTKQGFQFSRTKKISCRGSFINSDNSRFLRKMKPLNYIWHSIWFFFVKTQLFLGSVLFAVENC